jgi:hypothetical protein
MPVRPYDDLPPKPPLDAETVTKVIALVVGVLVVGLILFYR